jgi:hypothetical protein
MTPAASCSATPAAAGPIRATPASFGPLAPPPLRGWCHRSHPCLHPRLAAKSSEQSCLRLTQHHELSVIFRYPEQIEGYLFCL